MRKNILKRLFLPAALALLVSASLVGCTSGKPGESSQAVVNPMEPTDYDGIVALTGCAAKIPDYAENPACFIYDSKLGEVQYTTESGYTVLNFRVMKADAFTDISGLYYDWTVDMESDFNGWPCKELGYRGDEGDVHLCLFYDPDNKVMYSLSAQAADLDGFDVYGAALTWFD